MDYRRKIFVVALFVWYASFSIAMAIAPADREFWMAANILPMLLVAGLVVSYRIFPLSSISYFLITLFLTLHAIGVHYTYAEVPLGSWLQQALALDRNHFDRIVHFCFGFLLTYPWEEWFRLFAHVRGWLRYYLPNITILGLSALWEIVESWFAQLMNPDLGLVFLGSQGDQGRAKRHERGAVRLHPLHFADCLDPEAMDRSGSSGTVIGSPLGGSLMTFTTLATAPGPSLGQNRLFQVLLGCYLVLWIVLAISPVDRQDWLLENILTVISMTLLIVTYRRFQFSDLSYVLIILFMILHAIGAHYTYSKVPLGFWLRAVVDLDRNHYDRLVHFAFGLLLAYPAYELVLRRAKARHGWALMLAASTIVGMSGFFEVLESWVARIVSPELGTAYLGTQGDKWDAQKDTTMALIGVLLSLGFTSLFSRSHG